MVVEVCVLYFVGVGFVLDLVFDFVWFLFFLFFGFLVLFFCFGCCFVWLVVWLGVLFVCGFGVLGVVRVFGGGVWMWWWFFGCWVVGCGLLGLVGLFMWFGCGVGVGLSWGVLCVV